MLPTLGATELLIVFGIILVLFGSTKLPTLGKGLGEGIRNFRKGLKGDEPNELEEGNKQ
ncbi:MAG: twin-arginine translocase TatA/TatE family subunit [Acidobacteriota bacterium]